MGLERRVRNEVARRRWGLLARALLNNGHCTLCPPSISVRRISNFGLVKISPLSPPEWYLYSIGGKYDLKVRHLYQALTPEDLIGFNNTGNVCVWPSEEVLAHYVLENQEKIRNKSVVELGGGMSCLAGLACAKYCSPTKVVLTDGNSNSIYNVTQIVQENNLETAATCCVLKWGQHQHSKLHGQTFDVILAADCLFFDDTRTDLAFTIWSLMSDSGQALVTAPRRGKTLELFLNAALSVGFITQLIEIYDGEAWSRHLHLKSSCPQYDSDIHYPLLIVLKKPLCP